MTKVGGNKVPEITGAEHISPEHTGDNISAKKTAGYGYDSNSSVWRRLAVDATGQLKTIATISGDVTAATEYTDGDPAVANPTGGMPVFNSAGTVKAVSNTNPLPVTATISTTGLATDATDTNTGAISTNLGAKADASASSDTGTFSLISLFKRLLEKITTLNAKDFSTSAKQDSLLTELQAKADLTETQPVSLASVPSHAVTNAGTFAVQSDLTKVGGTAVDSNSGVKSAGTQRVVLATDQPQLTNALKVDGSATTQPVSGTFWQATQPVSGTVTANAGTGNFNVNVQDGAGTDITSTAGAIDINLKTSDVSLGGGSQYTEDAAAAANPVGTALNLIREDARAGGLTTADGDNVAARGNNKGELYVKTTDSDALLTTIDADTSNLDVALSTRATAAKQDTGNTSLSSIDGKITAVNTGAVVVSSSALPSGAATAAKQPALGTAGTASADVITVQGRTGMTALTVDGSGVTQPVSNGGLTELAAAINSNKVDVNIVSSDVATGGTSAADDADFTAGTTPGTPTMGVYESTPTTVTDGDLGTVGITSGRRLKTSATIDAALPAGNNNIGDVDVASSALPTGASTSAKQDTVIGHLDGVEGLLTTIDADTGNISTKIDTVAGAVSGTEMQVDVLTSALPSGAATSAKQDTGNTSLASIDGKITAVNTGAVVVASGAITETNSGAIKTSVELIDDAIKADDAAFTPGTTKVMMAGYEFDDTTPDSVDEGDAGAARMSANRNVYTQIRDAAGNERGMNVDASGNAQVDLAAVSTALYVEQPTAASLNMTEANSGAIATSLAALDNSVDGNYLNVNANIAGTDMVSGSGTATGALRVEIANNGTGTVGLNAGTNAIGKLAANSGVDIGDVDVTSLPVAFNAGSTSSTTQRVIQATGATGTLANVAGSASSVTLQAANTARIKLIMYNDSTADCYVKYGSTASATSFTWLMAAGSHIEESDYNGIVTGIWTSATGNMRVTEVT